MSRPTWETGWAYFVSKAGFHFPNDEWRIASGPPLGYFLARQQHSMKYLTKDQQTVLCVIILLLLTGLAVKTWRAAHPPRDRALPAPVQKP